MARQPWRGFFLSALTLLLWLVGTVLFLGKASDGVAVALAPGCSAHERVDCLKRRSAEVGDARGPGGRRLNSRWAFHSPGSRGAVHIGDITLSVWDGRYVRTGDTVDVLTLNGAIVEVQTPDGRRLRSVDRSWAWPLAIVLAMLGMAVAALQLIWGQMIQGRKGHMAGPKSLTFFSIGMSLGSILTAFVLDLVLVPALAFVGPVAFPIWLALQLKYDNSAVARRRRAERRRLQSQLPAFPAVETIGDEPRHNPRDRSRGDLAFILGFVATFLLAAFVGYLIA